MKDIMDSKFVVEIDPCLHPEDPTETVLRVSHNRGRQFDNIWAAKKEWLLIIKELKEYFKD